MDDRFFERPILNSPYADPARHWELDAEGRPTGKIIEARRTAQFITPVPRPQKRKRNAGQAGMVFDEGQASPRPGSSTTRPRSSTSCATAWTSGAPSAIRAHGE